MSNRIGNLEQVTRLEKCINEMKKPVTNGDRIRMKSNEELAAWVWGIESAGRAYGPRGKKAWLDWLEKEADE